MNLQPGTGEASVAPGGHMWSCPGDSFLEGTGGTGELGVYKYLQIFLVLVDVMELEHVRVFDELQDGDLSLHLRGRRNTQGQNSAWPATCTAAPGDPGPATARAHSGTNTHTFISMESHLLTHVSTHLLCQLTHEHTHTDRHLYRHQLTQTYTHVHTYLH